MKLNLLLTYVGPNRRSDNTVIEMDLEYTGEDIRLVSEQWGAAMDRLNDELETLDVSCRWPQIPLQQVESHPVESFGQLCAGLSIALQNQCRHLVAEQSVITFDDQDRCLVIFEHDEFSVGEQAGILALTLLEKTFRELQIDLGEFKHERSLTSLYAGLHATAAELVPPPDTTAIVQAALGQGVPVIKLERGLYEPVRGDFRIRMNSMLMLGHAGKRQIIDGTFALEKSAPAHGLIFDRQKVMNVAGQLQMAIPPSTRQHQPVISPRRAERAAREIGYPVVVRTADRRKGASSQLAIRGPEQLADALKQAGRFDRDLIVEGFIKGRSWHVIVSGHEAVAVVAADGAGKYPGEVHPSTWEMAINASRMLNVGMLSINIVTPDLSAELAVAGGAVVDLDVAPRIDELLGSDSALLEQAAERFVRWLIPEGEASRIPIIAVTGTNGKTTTSRMVAHIQQQTGRVTGLQCTDGRYINNEQVMEGDASAVKGHNRLLQDQSIEVAVFETHHAGIATAGFAFDWCDVAVCTNVTYEHIGHLGTGSLAEMIELKRSLIERARHVAVLNADSETCLSMLPFVRARRICLVSIEKPAAELARLSETDRYFCVIETRNSNEMIVIHDNESALDVMAVDEIPATFGGLARFNVSNAMQAIAACHAEGVGMDVIRQAMSTFTMSSENTPWRLNFYESLPFRVLVDFAHNPDGLARMAEFTDRIETEGRKIISFSAFRSDTQVRMMAEAVATHYDHYVLKNYGIPEHANISVRKDPHEINRIMHAVLLEAGVSEQQISIVSDEMEAVKYTFDMAREGDLVVLLLGYTGLEVIEDFMQDYTASYPAGAT